MTWFLQHYVDESTRTEPMVTFVEVENLCNELSSTFHWNVEFSTDTYRMNYVRVNGNLAYCFDTEGYVKDSSRILKNIEKSVRSRVG